MGGSTALKGDSRAVPLAQRALHPFALLQLAAQQVDLPNGKKVALGELDTAAAVQQYIKSATEGTNCDYVQALARKLVRNPWSREGRFRESFAPSPATLGIEREAKGQPLWGGATYFVSHCWAYKLKDLIGLVIRHYDSQPGTFGGRAFQPLYYWVDIFAVQQNFRGDFKDHPDSDFPSVIRSCQAVLFTIMPWRTPLCLERVWCLFEALQAVSAQVNLELLVEPIQSPQSMDKLTQTFHDLVVCNLDIRKCKATVPADRDYILSQVERTVTVDRFNRIMQDALKNKVLEVMLITAVQRNELESVTKMIKDVKVRITQRAVSFSGYTSFDVDDRGLKSLAEVVKASNLQAVTVHTTPGSKAGFDGYAALAAAVRNNNSLLDLTLGKGPRENLKLHESPGGWVTPKIAGALADMLAGNSCLRRLDLSRNIKLGGTGLAALAKGVLQAESSGLQELILAEVGADNKGVATLADALASASIARGAPGMLSAPLTLMGGSRPGSMQGMATARRASVLGAGPSTSSSPVASPSPSRVSQPARPRFASQYNGSPPQTFTPTSLFGRNSPTGSSGNSTPLSAMSTPLSPGSGGRPRVALVRLDLSRNPIGDGEACRSLGAMLGRCATLQQLSLRDCQLTSAGVTDLAEGLEKSHGIKVLDLGSNPKLGDAGAEALAGALRKVPTLTSLMLPGCGIGANGARALGSALSASGVAIQALVLDNNSVGNDGAAAIGMGLRGNSSVQWLSLRECGITSRDGFAGVAAGLHQNRAMRELDLRQNAIASGDASGAAQALADALKANTGLTKLCLAGCLSAQAMPVVLSAAEGRSVEVLR